MTEFILTRGWPLLLAVSFKSLFVVALAGMAALLLHRASAAARHLAWRLGVVGLLLLPALSVLLPGWAVPLPVRPPAPPAVVSMPPPPIAAPAVSPVSSRPVVPAAGSVSEAAPMMEASAPPRTATPWQVWAFGVWMVGVGIVLLPTLLGLVAVRSLERRCRPIVGGPPLDALAALTPRPVRLMTAPADGPAVPMTWGGRRPALLLPPDADAWPVDRLRATLLHELAHIERADWPAQMAAQIACALYWFNPLVWFAVRRMAQEAERACDDRVLSAGVVPAAYAGHLLDTVRGLQDKPHPAVLPMAQASTLESRLRAILQPKRRQIILTRKTITVAVLATIAVIVPIATLRPFVQACGTHNSEVNALTSPGDDDQPLPGGVKLQLVGVTEAGPSVESALTKPWWDPSGNVLPLPLLRKINGGNGRITSQTTPLQFCALAFKVASPQETPVTLEFQPRHSIGYSSIGCWPGKDGSPTPMNETQIDAGQGGYRVLYVAYPAGTPHEDIRVGVGAGLWKTTVSDENTRVGWSASETGQPTYVFGPLTKMDRGSVVTLSIADASSSAEASDDVRVVAVDAAGHERLPVSIGDNSNGPLDQIQSQFDLPPNAIKSVWLETRPFHWITFRNVSLRPRSYVGSGISQPDLAAEISGLTGKNLRDFKADMEEVGVYDKKNIGSKDVSAEEAKRMTTKDLITQTNRLDLIVLCFINNDPKVGLYRAYQCSNSMAELLRRKDFTPAFLQAYSSFDTNPKTNPHFEKDGGLFATGWMLSLWDYPPLRSQSEGHEKEILSALCKKYREIQKVNASYPKGQDPYGQTFFPLEPAQQFAKKAFPNARILSVHSMKDIEPGVKELEHLCGS